MFKYFISYSFMQNKYNSGFGNCFLNFKNKIKCHEDIQEIEKLISKKENNNFTTILFYKEVDSNC